MADLKTRRRRRIAILLTVFLLLIGTLVTLAWVSRMNRQNEALEHRAAGLAAYQENRYAEAVEHLDRYLDYQPEDAEAQFHFAQASLHAPLPEGRHLSNALNAFNEAWRLDPSNAEAGRQIVELYVGASRFDPSATDLAIEQADEVLARYPDDTETLRLKAAQLEWQAQNAPEPRRTELYNQALEAAQAGLEHDPKAFRLHLIALESRHALGTPAADLVEETQALVEQHPQDPGIKLVLVRAQSLAEDTDSAQALLEEVATQSLETPALVETTVSFLDTMWLYDRSLATLEAAAEQGALNRPLRQELIRRLFESQRYEALIKHAGETATTDSRTLALVAAAHLGMEQRERAQAVIQQLAARTTDPDAQRWVAVLRIHADPGAKAGDRVRVISQALEGAGNAPYLHALLGDAYAGAGDRAMAIREWQRAAALRPMWGPVRLRLARAQLEEGQAAEAVPAATEALHLMPTSLAARLAFIEARVMSLGERPATAGQEAEELARMIDEIQSERPGEPRSLVLRVALDGQTGATQRAAQTAETLLTAAEELPQPLLTQLGEISQRLDLGIEQQVDDALRKRIQGTPRGTLVEALDLARRGNPEDGLALLEDGLEHADDGGKAWRVATAQYLHAIGDGRAGEMWVSLAKAYPGDVDLQERAVVAAADRGDDEAARAALERIAQEIGTESPRYRVPLARWRLATSPSAEEAGETVTLLRQVVEQAPTRLDARLLLADALLMLDRRDLATRELRAASLAIPDEPRILLGLARLYQDQQQYPSAREAIEQVLALEDLRLDDYRTAATLLSQQGENQRAIQIVRQLIDSQGDSATTADRLLLATLYSRAGQRDLAHAAYQRLLTNAESSEVLGAALAFYDQAGMPQEASDVAARIDTAEMPEDRRHALLGDHHARLGDVEQAAAHYRRSAEAAPAEPAHWRRLSRFLLLTGDAEGAIAAADEGLRAAPQDPGLSALVQNRQLVRDVSSYAASRPLLTALLQPGAEIEGILSAVRALQEADAEEGATFELAATLAQLANAHPTVLPLQNIAAQALLDAQDTRGTTGDQALQAAREAARIAGRAARAFPSEEEPAAFHAQALAAQELWVEALGAASDWRNRMDGSPVGPDLLMAEALLRLNQPGSALERLAPHAGAAAANPAEHAPVASRLARAYVALGQTQRAADLLLPILGNAGDWRQLAMDLASPPAGQQGPRIEDPATAAQWLQRVREAIPAEASGERMTLAQAWWRLAGRSDDPAYRQEAFAVVEELTARPDATALAWYMRGVIAQNMGDLAAAEEAYREALQRNDGMAAAMNNLAMVLLNAGKDAEEALKLATAAVRADPNSPAFLDTLAAAQAGSGRVDDAIASLQQAMELAPDQPIFRENLIELLEANGRTEEAQSLREGMQASAAIR